MKLVRQHPLQISRRGFLKAFRNVMIGCGVTVAVPAGLYQYATLEAKWLSLERVKVPLRQLGSALEGFRIAQLSDIHLHPTQIEFVRKAVDIVNALDPDLVVLTGDFVLEEAASILELATVLSRIRARHGVYAILAITSTIRTQRWFGEGWRSWEYRFFLTRASNCPLGEKGSIWRDWTMGWRAILTWIRPYACRRTFQSFC